MCAPAVFSNNAPNWGGWEGCLGFFLILCSLVISYLTHPANSGSESAKELPLLKMPPNEKFSSVDIVFY
jgi:hypothetical protein